MALFKAHRVTTLPRQLEAYGVYFVGKAEDPTSLEIHVANKAGDAARRLPTKEDISAMITQKAKGISEVKLVEDIAGLTGLEPEVMFSFVKDATTDTSVATGGALYVRTAGTNENGVEGWTKVSETESMDLTLNWDSIVGKPTSSVVEIQNAVAQMHTHANMTELNQLSDSDGQLAYKGKVVATEWSATEW